MMSVIKSRRIASGGYISGETTRVESTYISSEPPVETTEPVVEPAIDYEAEFVVRLDLARKQMFEAGYQKGLEDGRKQFSGELILLKKLLSEIETGIDSVWDSCRAGVAKLGLQIGQKVVGEVALKHEELAFELAKRGILLAREQTEVTIFVNPNDLQALQAVQMDILAVAEGVRRIEIRSRASVTPGGVMIECELGTFDLRPEVQLESIEKVLEIEPELALAEESAHAD